MITGKAALLATWVFFWLASLAVCFVNLKMYVDSGSSSGHLWIFGLLLNLSGLAMDPPSFFLSLDSARLPTILCYMIFAVAIQAGIVCLGLIFSTIGICTVVGSMKIGILLILSNLIKFIPQIIFLYMRENIGWRSYSVKSLTSEAITLGNPIFKKGLQN